MPTVYFDYEFYLALATEPDEAVEELHKRLRELDVRVAVDDTAIKLLASAFDADHRARLFARFGVLGDPLVLGTLSYPDINRISPSERPPWPASTLPHEEDDSAYAPPNVRDILRFAGVDPADLQIPDECETLLDYWKYIGKTEEELVELVQKSEERTTAREPDEDDMELLPAGTDAALFAMVDYPGQLDYLHLQARSHHAAFVDPDAAARRLSVMDCCFSGRTLREAMDGLEELVEAKRR